MRHLPGDLQAAVFNRECRESLHTRADSRKPKNVAACVLTYFPGTDLDCTCRLRLDLPTQIQLRLCNRARLRAAEWRRLRLETFVFQKAARITASQFKGKPAARRGRKASGLRVDDLQIAGLPASSIAVLSSAVAHLQFTSPLLPRNAFWHR
jgi:hypothetical protein